MSITHLGSSDPGGSDTTITFTLGVGETIPAGSTIHVVGIGQNMGANPTCSDNVNGAYTRDAYIESAGTIVSVPLFRFSNNALLEEADVITIDLDGTVSNRGIMVAWSDDLDLVSPLDQAADTDTGTGTTPATGGQTLNNDNARWIGVLGIAAAEIVDFNEDAEFTPLHSEDFGSARAGAYAYRDVSSAETNDYTPTLDNSRVWAVILQGYKMADASADTFVPQMTASYRRRRAA